MNFLPQSTAVAPPPTLVMRAHLYCLIAHYIYHCHCAQETGWVPQYSDLKVALATAWKWEQKYSPEDYSSELL